MKNRVGIESEPHRWVTEKEKSICKNRIRTESQSRRWVTEKEKSSVCKNTLTDYCSHAGLHGVQYIGVKDTTLTEKLWWLIIVLASLLYCLYMISLTWTRWQNHPVILNFEKEQRPIWSIPFPAVTICPANKVRQRYYNYSYYFINRDNLTEEEYKYFWDISLICNLEQYRQEFYCNINFTDEDAIMNIKDVAPRLNETVFYSIWQSQDDQNLFEEHYNSEGICFTFNSLSQDDMYTKEIDYSRLSIKYKIRSSQWTLEDGYKSALSMDSYPRRTAHDGYGSGLRFVLSSYAQDTDYICGACLDGYKIILHNPVETSKIARQFLLIGTQKKATIMIKPELTTTSKDLKSINPHERGCYFSNEKSLRFYKYYTENNCQLECKANVTEQYCGCVSFFLPRDENSKICGFGKMTCVEEIKKKIILFGLLKKYANPSNKEMYTKEFKIFNKCNCIPACTNLQFNAEMSHTNLHAQQTLQVSSLWDAFPSKVKKEIAEGTLTLSQVEIFFKGPEFLALERKALYAFNDFVADCGGLLGLFLGFSLLSLVEILYFLTLRLWCKIRKGEERGDTQK